MIKSICKLLKEEGVEKGVRKKVKKLYKEQQQQQQPQTEKVEDETEKKEKKDKEGKKKKAEEKKTAKSRSKYDMEQLEEMEKLFNSNKYPEKEVKEKLAERLGISYHSLNIWIRNRRRKEIRSGSSGRVILNQINSYSYEPLYFREQREPSKACPCSAYPEYQETSPINPGGELTKA